MYVCVCVICKNIRTRNSARLTDQRGSSAFSCSPFIIHVHQTGVVTLNSNNDLDSLCILLVFKAASFDYFRN